MVRGRYGLHNVMPHKWRVTFKVLNQSFRTLTRLPYTHLKKNRTEKKLVTEYA